MQNNRDHAKYRTADRRSAPQSKGRIPVKKSSKNNDYSGIKFLGIMFVAVAIVCTGVLCVNKYKARQRARQDALAQQTRSTVIVTFPEGRTMMQYGTILEEKNVCSAESFFEAMKTNDFTDEFDFLPSNEILQSRDYPLEGYLFPDTYEFYEQENAASVIRRLLRNFQARVPEEMITYANENGEGFNRIDMSFDQAIILASIVERESSVLDQLDKIAACFYNRIENPAASQTGGKLQSDATKFYPYVVGQTPEGFHSEYNTYDFAGLPKGPICCPSIETIKAAVYPDKACKDYFFYTDINGKHYYAQTYQQHLKNIKYCKDNGIAE